VHGYEVSPSAGRGLKRKTNRHVSTRFNTPPLPPIRHPSESWGIPVGGHVSGAKSQRSLDDEDGGGALAKRYPPSVIPADAGTHGYAVLADEARHQGEPRPPG
jgi:hypothetical protein